MNICSERRSERLSTASEPHGCLTLRAKSLFSSGCLPVVGISARNHVVGLERVESLADRQFQVGEEVPAGVAVEDLQVEGKGTFYRLVPAAGNGVPVSIQGTHISKEMIDMFEKLLSGAEVSSGIELNSPCCAVALEGTADQFPK